MQSFAAVTVNDTDPHKSMIIKGLIAVLGIIFFFFTERGLNMIADWRTNRQKKEKPCSRVRVMRDQSSIKSNANTEKICKNKYSSYPYCYDEIAMDTKDDHHHHHAKNTCDKTAADQPQSSDKLTGGNHHNHNHNDLGHSHDDNGGEIAQGLLNKHNNRANSEQQATLENVTTISTKFDDSASLALVVNNEKLMPEENFTVILREHESKHHGHSHTHGHVHSPPGSLSSVAWMVVMGDGLHNFTDGMTIGAAFSNSIPGGFSTAVAVFCHELPHELGDFAVLLKAGMSAKQAVYYNILSSVLSFFGMMFGIWLGEIPEASAWIFACAAGLFIYIALVDMVCIGWWGGNLPDFGGQFLLLIFYFVFSDAGNHTIA